MSQLIDTSLFYGSWPFRAHLNRTPGELKAFAAAHGVKQAWIASAPAILYPDPMQGNELLFGDVGEDPFFIKVAVIDVTLATWKRDLHRSLTTQGCRVVKLLPNYHQVDVKDPRVRELAEICSEMSVPIAIQLRMMDERGHHPLMKVPGVPAGAIVQLANEVPQARFLACGAYHGDLGQFKDAPNLWAELSFVESGHALVKALAAMGPDRLVFGSHTPLLNLAAQIAKLDAPAADVEPAIAEKIRTRNAQILLG